MEDTQANGPEDLQATHPYEEKYVPSFKLLMRESPAMRLLEIYVWLAVALVAAWPFFYDGILFPKGALQEIFSVQGKWIFASFGVLLFPIIFRLIFEAYPLQALRRRIRQRRDISSAPMELDERKLVTSSEEMQQLFRPSSSYEWLYQSSDEPKRFLACLASQSSATARGIYSRAGVYLLVGVGIAFSGLAFFYLETGSLKSTNVIGSDLMVYAPRFGILFFIELIAFFFLRQYRSAMDEFRYYESLQRHREELLALSLLAEKQGKSLDGAALVKQGAYYSGKEVLAKGQSTEILEARKMEKDELELLTKVVEAVGKKKA